MTHHRTHKWLAGLVVAALELGVGAHSARALSRGEESASHFQQAAEGPAYWRLLLNLPLGGVGLSGGSRSTQTMVPVFGLTLAKQLEHTGPGLPWTIEGEAGMLADSHPRFHLRLRVGPSFALIDTRKTTERGSTLVLQTQAGLIWWGSEGFSLEYQVLNDGSRIGLMAQVALEGVRWTSRAEGWCARLRGTLESPFLRLPDEHTAPAHSYWRWATGLMIDLGRAF